MKRLCISVCCVIALTVSCNSATGTKELELKKDDTLSQVKPEKPVQIKLKRNNNSEYSWELKSDSPEKVIEVDKKLRNYTEDGKEKR